jgi:hypothetical protein
VARSVDQELVARLAERGVDVTVRQARRWREDGQLPDTVPTSRGREGFVFAYRDQDSVVDQAERLSELMQLHRDADDACVVLFLQGFHPRERALRSAYKRIYTNLCQPTGNPDDSLTSWDAAERNARSQTRRTAREPAVRTMRARLQKRGRANLLGDALLNISMVFGGPVALANDSLVALGADEAPFNGVKRQALSEIVRSLGPAALAKTASETPLSKLQHARDTLVLLHEIVARAAEASRLTGAHTGFQIAEVALSNEVARALLIPATSMILDSPLGSEFTDGLGVWEKELPRFAALASLGGALPSEWHAFLQPLGAQQLAQQPPGIQKRVNTALRRWAKTHPTESALLQQT